jgi:hypothetical protein
MVLQRAVVGRNKAALHVSAELELLPVNIVFVRCLLLGVFACAIPRASSSLVPLPSNNSSVAALRRRKAVEEGERHGRKL